VDDIGTNLTVLSGLLAPYRMRITLCTSGEEAIELVKNETFDFVLMDHMMPGMDGVETTARIREWEESRRAKKIPIIALTANAISGMREMFLEQGFDDYLSKPIEIDKLNEVMEKWIPREKQKKGTGEWGLGNGDEGGNQPLAPSLQPLILPGVDTAKGVAMTGGTVAGYKKVLSIFCMDAEERLDLLQNVPDEAGLPLFTTQVHALKSALATIGDAALSDTAAALEAAGKIGDMAAIAEGLPDFAEQLAELAANIGNALGEVTEGGRP
jgi:CheY-like chemotaxis protein